MGLFIRAGTNWRRGAFSIRDDAEALAFSSLRGHVDSLQHELGKYYFLK
jgi:hypothetical protein